MALTYNLHKLFLHNCRNSVTSVATPLQIERQLSKSFQCNPIHIDFFGLVLLPSGQKKLQQLHCRKVPFLFFIHGTWKSRSGHFQGRCEKQRAQ